MDDFTDDGFWEIAGSDGAPLPGSLEISENRVRLTLDRFAVRDRLGSAATSPEAVDNFTWPDVTGELRAGTPIGHQVALFGLRPSSWGLDQIVLTAEYATVGHVAPAADGYIEAVIEFDWLRSWIQPPHLTNSDWGGREEPLRFDLAREVLCRARVDDVEVEFITDHSWHVDAYKADVERHAYAKVTFDNAISLRTIRTSWLRPIQDLLIVAIGGPVQLTRLMLRPRDPRPDREWLVDAVVSLNQRSPVDDASPAKLMSYASDVILSGQDFVRACSSLLPQWFAVAAKHREAVVRLNAPSYARFMYLDNECALVSQALEALHGTLDLPRRDLPPSEFRQRVSRIMAALDRSPQTLTEADRQWAEKVLQSRNEKSWTASINDLLDRAGDLGVKLANELPTFAELVEAMRHSVSHAPRGVRPEDDDEAHRTRFERRHFVKQLAASVARVILLGETGFADAGRVAAEKHKVQFAIDRLRALADS
jgi:hypothetical protein